MKIVDDDIYGKDRFFPSVATPVEQPDRPVMRGHRLLFLKLHPIQFNPVTRELKVYSRLEVRLKYNKPAQSNKDSKAPAISGLRGDARQSDHELPPPGSHGLRRI